MVVAPEDADRFCELALSENLEATRVARVKAEPRLTMTWNGNVIVDLSREFLNSNGAKKHMDVKIADPAAYAKDIPADFEGGINALA